MAVEKGEEETEKDQVLQGLKPYRGGEELRRATAALCGSAVQLETVPPVQPDAQDFEGIYDQGLALQEAASQSSHQQRDQQRLLREACTRYEAAWRLRKDSHAALYNWGVALSDLARVGEGPARTDFLLAAAEKYAESLKWNPNNPQALNNWGLVLQELSTMRGPSEQRYLVHHSIAKFRRAIHLRPEFDRACYNLGTVFYSHACTLQAAARQALSSFLTQDLRDLQRERATEAATNLAFALAGQYIAVAYALSPAKDVYRSSLSVVQSLLPLPYLRAGFLTATTTDTELTCGERWQRHWFVLDHESFRVRSAELARDESDYAAIAEHDSDADEDKFHRIMLADILTVRKCSDPSLPKGFAMWVSLHSRPQGHYYIAAYLDELEGWVDALHLAGHLASTGRVPALHTALAAPAQPREETPEGPTPLLVQVE
eukprot:jgi/Botrbrau1/6484/Bobra.0034s0057.1